VELEKNYLAVVWKGGGGLDFLAVLGLSELVVLGLVTGINNNGAALEEVVSAPLESQSSWLPALPHVLTAAMANFMFGYHIGYVPLTLGLPIFSVSLKLNC